MEHDFRTSVVTAVVTFILSFPVLLPTQEGQLDNYGPMRWLLVIGPVAMIAIAWWERRQSQGAGKEEGK